MMTKLVSRAMGFFILFADTVWAQPTDEEIAKAVQTCAFARRHPIASPDKKWLDGFENCEFITHIYEDRQKQKHGDVDKKRVDDLNAVAEKLRK